MAHDTGRDEGTPLTRRRFLARSLWAVAGAIAGALALIGLVPVVAPAFRKASSRLNPIGPVGGALEPGGPDLSVEGRPVLTSFTSLVEGAAGQAERQETSVYVLNGGNGQFTVFDTRCTHLGCPVRWYQAVGQFICPCHGGAFDLEGEVVAGPPPRPLDRYQWEVQNGVLYAGLPLDKGSGL